jgi:hypothetical protein
MVSMTQRTAEAAARAAEINSGAAAKPSGFVASATTPMSDPTKQSAAPMIKAAPFQINPLGNRQQWLKFLVYGKHGSGKTTLAATSVDCEAMRDILFIDAEQGETAVQDNPRIKNDNLISHVSVKSFKQVAYIHQFLQAHCIARDAKDLPRLRELESKITGVKPTDIEVPKQFRTVLVDSLTEIDQYCLYALRGVSQDQLLDDPGDVESVEWKGYGKNNEMVKMLCRAYRDLPMHVIFSCSEQWTQNELKKFHYTPAMTGKLSGQIQGMVDIVGYLVVSAQENDQGELNRRMLIQPGEINNARFDAKNRRAIYKKSSWDDPTMSVIMRDTGMIKG